MSTLSTTNLKNPSSGSNNIVLGADGSATITTLTGTTITGTSVRGGITSATAVASTSGTSIDFTSIPSYVKRVTVMFNGVSTSGTSVVRIQLGTSSGVATSGYLGSASTLATSVATTNFTAGFDENASGGSTAASIRHGAFSLETLTSNIWTCAGVSGFSNENRSNTIAGSVSLAAVLDRVRITTANGTDTFDAGSINLLWE